MKKLTIKSNQGHRYQELRDIPGYEGRYAATKNGQIYSYINHRFIKSYDNLYGYLISDLVDKNGKRKHVRVHRAVAMAYLPNPLGLEQVNHMDEDTYNNKLSNLEWCSREYNINYGTRNERVSKKVYCQELNRVFKSQSAAAKELNLYSGNISACCCGRIKTTGGYHFCFWSE